MTDQDGVAARLDQPLSPEEVLRPHFPRAVMGYDRTEVDYFLEVVAVQQRRLLDRVAELEAANQPDLPPAPDEGDGDRRLTEVLELASRLVGERRQAHRVSARPGR